MTVVGHTPVVRALRAHLPPVTLLLGPPSVGKWTLARHLAEHHRINPADRSPWPDGLGIDAARRVIAFVSTAGFGPVKLVTARLDATSTAALNALLKTLEEPPPTARFILTASQPTLPTITSRASVYRLGTLSVDELTAVLIAQGVRPDAAPRAAILGRGQVRPALAAHGNESARAAVLNLMRAVATADAQLFDRTVRSWDTAAQELLTRWFVEAVTDRWALFTEADSFGLHHNQPRLRAMLTAVSRVNAARPRLAVRAALEPFLVT